MEKTYNIEQRGDEYVYIETTSFVPEQFGHYLKKNIQIVEYIFKNKEDLEDYLIEEREKKENSRSQLSYNLTQTNNELKSLDLLVINNNIRKK